MSSLSELDRWDSSYIERGKFSSPGRWNWNVKVKAIKKCRAVELKVPGGPGAAGLRGTQSGGGQETGDSLLNPK